MKEDMMRQAIGEIDDALIEGAEGFSRAKRSGSLWAKYISAAVAAVAVIVLCSTLLPKMFDHDSTQFPSQSSGADENSGSGNAVSTAVSEDDTANSAGDTDLGVTVNYVYLLMQAEDEGGKFGECFEDPQDYGLYPQKTQEVFEELKNNTVIDPIDGKEMTYSYSQCAYPGGADKNYGDHYCVYDFYKSDSVDLAVLHGSDLICYYYNRNDEANGARRPSSEEAEIKAESFILSVIPQNVFDGFELVSVKNDTTGLFSYTVTYSKKSSGYATDETITMYLGKSGDVIGYNGYNVGKYDPLSDRFNRTAIENAKAALTAKINSLGLKNLNMNEPFVTANANGDLYLRLDFSYEDENGSVCGQTAFINVG